MMVGIKNEEVSNDIATLKTAAKEKVSGKNEIVPVDALIDLDPWLEPYREPIQKR